jgi:hypothetical protein
MKQTFDFCFASGKKAEFRFADSCLIYIKYPTKEQDMFEHWDVQGLCIAINDKHYKFDVKSTQKLKYSTPEKIMEEVWVEGTNVRGKDGWIKGKADYIVFEREQTWFIVNRNKLLELTEKKLKENNYKKGKGVYLIHTRTGRQDKVTQVPFADMKTIEHYELSKRS